MTAAVDRGEVGGFTGAARQMNGELTPQLSRPRKRELAAGVRVSILAGAGAATGWLSGMGMALLEEKGGPEHMLQWLPGAIYAVLWLGVAWWPGGLLITRERVKRSWGWTLLLLPGITACYATAYQVAIRVGSWVTEQRYWPVEDTGMLAIAGGAGGIVGSLGLASLWALLYPAAENWTCRSALTALGGALGMVLAVWDIEEITGLTTFFLIWQGGMAAGLAAADGWLRREPVSEG